MRHSSFGGNRFGHSTANNDSPLRNSKLLKSCGIILGILIALPGIVFAILAVWIGLSVRPFDESAFERTEGTVIELVEKTVTHRSRAGRGFYIRNTSLVYCPVIEYTDHLGQWHEYRPGGGSNPPQYSVGDKVEIFYDRDSPDSVKTDNGPFLYFISILFGIIAAVDFLFVTIWLAVILLIFRSPKRPKNITEEPAAVSE